MRTPYRWRKCTCTGKWLENMNIRCEHHKTCFLRKLDSTQKQKKLYELFIPPSGQIQ